jgi:hypothetical protein
MSHRVLVVGVLGSAELGRRRFTGGEAPLPSGFFGDPLGDNLPKFSLQDLTDWTDWK